MIEFIVVMVCITLLLLACIIGFCYLKSFKYDYILHRDVKVLREDMKRLQQQANKLYAQIYEEVVK